MKIKTFLFILMGGFVLNCFISSGAYATSASDDAQAAYRRQWLETENVYGNEYESVIKERDRKRDIKLYMDMGKDYLEKKDNPAALFCFKKILELEAGETKKAYSREAQEFIVKIEEAMQREIINEISGLRKEDWGKRRRGVERILQRKPADLDLAARKRENDPDALRRKELEEELLRKRKTLEEEMKLKKLEMQIKQAETDTMLQYAAELIAETNYLDALEVVNKVLRVEPSNVRAHELKNKAMFAIEEEKTAIERTKEETRQAIERLKKKEDEVKQRAAEEKARLEAEAKQKEFTVHFSAAKKSYADHEYRLAIEEVKNALAVYPDNSEAKMLLSEIKGIVNETMKSLDTAKSEEDARKALEAIKKQKDEEAKKVLEALRKQAEEERRKEVAVRLASGKNYFQQQNYLEAVKDFKAVLVLEPDQEDAKRYLAEIKDVLSKAAEAFAPSAAEAPDVKDAVSKTGAEQKPADSSSAVPAVPATGVAPAAGATSSQAPAQKEASPAVKTSDKSSPVGTPAAASVSVGKDNKTAGDSDKNTAMSAGAVSASPATPNKGFMVTSQDKTKTAKH